MKYLIFISFLLIPCFISAQSIIEGTLKAEDNKPVADVSIMYHPKGDVNTILGFGFSGENGKFRLEVAQQMDSLTISFRSMAFRDTIITVPSNKRNILLVLHRQERELREVVVKSLSINKHGDTTTFFVKDFSNERDRSIGDVINKMPGFGTENGEITYQGRKISKYYIEGLDLLENRYQLANQNLPHKDVGSVEVLENHQSKKVLENVVKSDDVVLNIKLKNNITLTGTAELAAGAPFPLWGINLTPMFFSKGQQIIAGIKGNNMGNDLAAENVPFEMSGGNLVRMFGPSNKNVNIPGLSDPEIKQQRYLNNQAGFATYNHLLKLKNDAELKINASSLLNQIRKNGRMHIRYFMPDTVVDLTENSQCRYYDRTAGLNVSYTKNVKKRYIKNQASFNKYWDYALSNISGTSTQQTRAETPYQNLSNYLELVVPVGKSLFNLFSDVKYTEAPQQLVLTPGVFAENLNQSQPYTQTVQYYATKNLTTHHYTSFMAIRRRFTFDTKVGLKFNYNEISTQIATVSDILPADSLRNGLSWNQLIGYAEEMIRYKTDKLNMGLSLPAEYFTMQITSRFQEVPHQVKDINFRPNLYLSYNPWPLLTLSGSAGYSARTDDARELLMGYIISDYRSIQRASNQLDRPKNIFYSGRIEFKIPTKGVFIHLNWMHNNSEQDYLLKSDMLIAGVFNYSKVRLTNRSSSDNFSGEISKYFFKVNTTLTLKPAGYYSRRQFMVQNQLAWTEFSLYELMAGLVCNKFRNFALNYGWKPKLLSQYSEQQTSRILQQSQIFDVTWFAGKQLWLALENEYYTTSQKDQKGFEAMFTHLTVGYKLKKRGFSFILRCTNLFDAKDVVNYYSGDYSLIESFYQIRPREISFTVSFRLVDLKK